MSGAPIDIVASAAAILDRLGIPYVVGGSLASAAHGAPRTTADADLVIDVRKDQVDALTRELAAGFYVSREAMLEAIRGRDCFNAISLDAPFKIDFFVLGTGPFDQEEFRRRTRHDMTGERQYSLMVKTAEDTILRKLVWFRKGREVSDQQWHDVLNVLAVNRGRLDDAYLDRWAADLDIRDLLAKARAQVGG